MRLSNKEIQTISDSFGFCLENISFKLYLFGSRTDDSKKGGDIDLLVVVSDPEKSNVVNLKSKIRRKIFESIPEQKIDITVATDREINVDPFLAQIFPSAILMTEK
jgi:hypothetical protein